jgi:flagellar motility protein MotE (MotC chaperone)
MKKPTPSERQRRRRRRQKGLLTALGLVFAVSAILRLGALDFAMADTDAPAGVPTADARSETAGAPLPASIVQPLQAALADIDELQRDLEAREAAVMDRERAVATAQALVEERLAELEATERRLEALIARSDGAAESDIERLTRVYETMAPDEAAALFSEMTPSFAAGFLSRMSAGASAALLAEMAPEDAYAVSVIIATRNASAPRLIQSDTHTEN